MSTSYYNHRRRKQFHFGGAERNIHRDHRDLRCNMNINKVSRVKYAPRFLREAVETIKGGFDLLHETPINNSPPQLSWQQTNQQEKTS